jgi:transposase
MRAPTPPLKVTEPQREVLEALSRSQTAAHRDVQRAKALLMASDGFATTRVAKELGVSPATVSRWRECFERDGLRGSVKVGPGRGRKPSISPEKVQEIVHATLHEKPPGETHWSCRSMARAHGVSHTTVQKIWAARGLKPHRVETFKLSTDPRFEEKLADVVGLYLNPPERAIVLSMDEKSQIQALDRTQPSLPMKPGRAGTMTHDYKRNGTTTLFAALNVLTGSVIGQAHATDTASSSRSCARSIGPSRRPCRSTSSSTTTPRTSTPTSRRGWPSTPGSTCTSRRPPRAG